MGLTTCYFHRPTAPNTKMDILHRGIEGVVSEEMEAYQRNSMAAQVDGDCIASYDLWAIEGSYEKVGRVYLKCGRLTVKGHHSSDSSEYNRLRITYFIYRRVYSSLFSTLF